MADETKTTVVTIRNEPQNSPKRPDFQRDEYKAQVDARELCRALTIGSTAVRAGGEKFLPKWPAEKPEHYKIRAHISRVARYYQRTVQASVGMLVAPPPELSKDANQVIVDDWEDIDGRGTAGKVFVRELLTDAINGGFVAIYVDAPPVPENAELNPKEEADLGLRPFWIKITSEQIISWIVEVPDWAGLIADYKAGVLTAEQVQTYAKQTVLRQVVIHEPTDVAAGDYGNKCVDRYKVLRLTDAGVTYVVWEKRVEQTISGAPILGGEYFVKIASGVLLGAKRAPFREIPLAIIYGGSKRADFVAEPPMLPLAELNLDHYNVSADRRYLMRLCHAPTLVLVGHMGPDMDDEGTGAATQQPVKVGPNSVITLPIGGSAGYVSANPNALDSSQVEREELVRQMAMLGLSFLAKDRRMAMETATGRQLDDASESAALAMIEQGTKDGLEQALKFHAFYRGVDAPEIVTQTTGTNHAIDPQIAALLWQAVLEEKIDTDSWITYVKTGELPEDIADRVRMMKAAADARANAEIASAKDALKRPAAPAAKPVAGAPPVAAPPVALPKKPLPDPSPKS